MEKLDKECDMNDFCAIEGDVDSRDISLKDLNLH